jgi:uncharacterized protein
LRILILTILTLLLLFMGFATSEGSTDILYGVIAILIGFLAGVCGGLWGIGGGWIANPVLAMLGYKWEVVFGINLFHMTVTTLLPFYDDVRKNIHKSKFKKIERLDQFLFGDYENNKPKLDFSKNGLGRLIGLPMAVSSSVTAVIGVLVYFEYKQKLEMTTNYIYCAFLVLMIAYHFISKKLKTSSPENQNHISISGIINGTWAGFLSGFLGIGGGLFHRPVLRYIIRIDESNTRPIAQLNVLLTSVCSIVVYYLKYRSILWSMAAFLSVGGMWSRPLGTNFNKDICDAGMKEKPQSLFIIAAVGILASLILKLIGYILFGRIILIALGIVITVYIFILVRKARFICKQI